MGALVHRTLCCHGNHVHLAVLVGDQHHDALDQLLFQLVAQLPQTVHIHSGNFRCQQLHTLYFLHLIHHVAQRVFGRLAL